MSELKCIREIHTTMNCRPGGSQALLLKKLVNRQNKLRPEVTLIFSNPGPASICLRDNPEVAFGAHRSAIDVLNDARPRAGLSYIEEVLGDLEQRCYGFSNDLGSSIGHKQSHILDRSQSDSWKTPSLTSGISSSDLWELPSSAPYSNVWQTAYAVMDIERPALASHIKENYQYTGDWTIGIDSML